MILLSPMTDSITTATSETDSPVRTLLAAAAVASLGDDVALDEFMRAAWLAYTEARPGLRDALEERAMRAQFDDLRARGQLALA